jgi:hypothetical protein
LEIATFCATFAFAEVSAREKTIASSNRLLPREMAINSTVKKAETIKLYRAISEAEFNQIQKTGQFTMGPNSLSGKFFAESATDAEKWGKLLNGSSQSRLIEIEMIRDTADRLQRWERLDGIGPARYAELEQLCNVAIKEAE